jgi:prevent-host-death family protein
MTKIGLFEAKTKFSEICDKVASKGETVIVTRRGKPLVKIEPIATYPTGGSEIWKLREKFDKEHGPQTEDFELPPRTIEKKWKNPLDD